MWELRKPNKETKNFLSYDMALDWMEANRDYDGAIIVNTTVQEPEIKGDTEPKPKLRWIL